MMLAAQMDSFHCLDHTMVDRKMVVVLVGYNWQHLDTENSDRS